MPKSLPDFLQDLHLLGAMQADVVEAVRALVSAQFPDVTQELKYGGIRFASGVALHLQDISIECNTCRQRSSVATRSFAPMGW